MNAMTAEAADTYSTHEAAELTGLSYRMLDWWTRTGMITPHVEARGQGTRRAWTAEQVEWLQRIADAYRQAEAAGMELGSGAIGDIWVALASGRAWSFALSVEP